MTKKITRTKSKLGTTKPIKSVSKKSGGRKSKTTSTTTTRPWDETPYYFDYDRERKNTRHAFLIWLLFIILMLILLFSHHG